MNEEMRVVRAVLAGNTDAFEELVRANERNVYGLALKMLGNEADAQDAAQEAFIKAYVNLSQFSGESRFSVWLYRLTYNQCVDMLRRKKRENVIPLDTEDGEVLQLPDPGKTPEEEAERRDEQQTILRAVHSLPEKFSQVILMRGVDGMSYTEIAEALHVKEGTVKSRLNRGRQMLAEILRENGTFPELLRLKDERGGEAR